MSAPTNVATNRSGMRTVGSGYRCLYRSWLPGWLQRLEKGINRDATDWPRDFTQTLLTCSADGSAGGNGLPQCLTRLVEILLGSDETSTQRRCNVTKTSVLDHTVFVWSRGLWSRICGQNGSWFATGGG